MKKFGFLKFILLCALILIICVPIVACNSEESVIPKELGKSEGLWFYYGNTRSLSDGTISTELLTSVFIDGTEYLSDELEINDIAYATDTKEIFYIIAVGNNAYAYHFNYQTQQSGYLCNLKSTETKIEVSASYILFVSSDEGILFNHYLNLLGDNFVGFHIPDNSNIVRKVDYGEDERIIYYFDGHKIVEYSTYSYGWLGCVGTYMYDFYNSKAINTATGEEIPLVEADEYPNVKSSYYNDGILYVLMKKEGTDEYAYFSFIDGRVQFIHDFGECKYLSGVSMDKFEFTVYGEYKDNVVGVPKDKYYRYNPETGKMKKIFRIQRCTDTDESAQYYQYETNGYTFYLKYRSYDSYLLGGSTPCKWCCYLYRESAKVKKEVLQYKLNISFGEQCFYNDICNF